MLEKLFISLICFTKCSEATYRVVFFNILFIELFREGFYVSSLVYQDLNVRNRGRYKEGETCMSQKKVRPRGEEITVFVGH